jgi:hypothetical protein
MNINELKKVFEAGGLKKATVVGCFNKWFLHVETLESKDIQVTIRQSKKVRPFEAVETALKAAHQIGFNDVQVKEIKDGKWSQR